MAKNDDAWTRSPSRINLKIIFLQNSQFFMNYAKGPVKIHWLEAEKITFDPWRIIRIASFCTLLIICSQAKKFMTELHAICHKIESTLYNKVTINATFTSLMSSMPSHSLCYAKLVQHRFNTSLILNFSEKMFSFCNVNLNNFKSFKYQNKF